MQAFGDKGVAMSKKITVDLLKEKNITPIGCKIEDGVVLPTYSPKRMGDIVEGEIVASFYSNCAGRFFLVVGDKLYSSVGGETFAKLGELEGKSPYMVEDSTDGDQKCIIVCKNAGYSHNGRSFSPLQPFAPLATAIAHRGRIFGVDEEDRYLIRWSGLNGIEDGDQKLYGAGKLKLDSKKGKVLNFLESKYNLVLVREFGITMLRTVKSPEYYALDIADTLCEKIYPNTTQCVNGKMLFCTDNGLYIYNGNAFDRVKHRFYDKISCPKCAVCYDGVYYLACTIDGHRDILCYDTISGESYLADICGDSMCVNDGVWVFNSSGIFKLNKSENYYLRLDSNFGINSKKTLSYVNICGNGEITIKSDKNARVFQQVCGNVKVGMQGDNFTLSVIGKQNIKSFTATVEVCNGV